MVEPSSLTQFYDTLKSNPDPAPVPAPQTVNGSVFRPRTSGVVDKYQGLRMQAVKHCNELKDKCAKHLLLDIYVKVLPLDKEYIDGNMGQCKNDIDCMLSNKNMDGVRYLRSCYEKTNAPLLEFLNRSVDVIGREYMNETNETIKDAEANGIDLPPQIAPTTDDKEVNSQLVDVKNDPEYETFIDALKKKTIDKIVNDITKIITDKKEDKNMEFDLKSNEDSAVQESMNYMQKKAIKDGKEIDSEKKEKMIGLAVREATLFQIDRVFNQRSFNEFTTAMRLGHGIVANESAVNTLLS